jgi:glycosyltransferase involved in cell wall biosynthesis
LKKKLLIFHPYLAPYRIDLYNSLSELYEVQVLLTGSLNERKTLGFDLAYVNGLAKFKYKYEEHGLYLGRHLLSTIYYKQIKLFRPDVVLAHELGINTLFAIIFKTFYRYKLFVTIDDSPDMIKDYGSIRRLLQAFVVKHATAIFVVHPDVKLFLESKFQKSTDCSFVYFPLLQNESELKGKFLKAEKEVIQLISLHKLESERVILFVGRLEFMKSPDLLLRAFKRLDNSLLRLVFVGDGSLMKELKDSVEAEHLESKVFFTGRLSGANLYAWYRIADVFVLPSQFEPFGAVVNEALVAGCQVIVSDKVGSNCLIDSSNGIVFESNNESNLVYALNTIIECLPELPKKNLRQSKMKFSFDDLFVQFKKLC